MGENREDASRWNTWHWQSFTSYFCGTISTFFGTLIIFFGTLTTFFGTLLTSFFGTLAFLGQSPVWGHFFFNGKQRRSSSEGTGARRCLDTSNFHRVQLQHTWHLEEASQ